MSRRHFGAYAWLRQVLRGPNVLVLVGALQFHDRREHVPKITARIRELDGDLVPPRLFAFYVDDARFTFFVRVAVYEQNFLAALHTRSKRHQPPVKVHRFCHCHFAKRMVFRRAPVYADRDVKRQALAAAFFYHFLPL